MSQADEPMPSQEEGQTMSQCDEPMLTQHGSQQDVQMLSQANEPMPVSQWDEPMSQGEDHNLSQLDVLMTMQETEAQLSDQGMNISTQTEAVFCSGKCPTQNDG